VRNIRIFSIVSGMLLLCSIAVLAQVDPEIDARLERRWHPFQESTLPYRLFIPDDYSPTQPYPLILFLHGAMWRGSDNVTHLDNELAVFWVQEAVQSIQPCFVVLPQCPTNQTWEVVSGQINDFPSAPMLEWVVDLLDSLEREFAIDADRISCAGKSIGGLGVYGLLSRYPDRFAAAMPVAGMTVYQDISRISQIPIWILHAKDDPSVSIDVSLNMVQLLEQEGSPFIYTHCDNLLEACDPISIDSMDQEIATGQFHIISIFDTATHQIEPKVVKTYGLAEWLLSQERNQMGVSSLTFRKDFQICTNYPNPFNFSTIVQYKIEEYTQVDILIFNAAGRRVRHLLSTHQSMGEQSVLWDSRDDFGNPLSTGIYFCQIRTGISNTIHKLLLIR